MQHPAALCHPLHLHQVRSAFVMLLVVPCCWLHHCVPAWLLPLLLLLCACSQGQVVTCVAYDLSCGFVWTGCADGSVMLHAGGRWGFASLPTSVGLPVRSMAVDSRHFCWVGDEAGIIRVLNLDPATDRLTLRIQLAPPQTERLVWLAAQQGPAAAAAAAASAASGSSSAAGVAAGSVVKGTPVYAMAGRGSTVFSSGGKLAQSITVWDSYSYKELEVAELPSFGATYAFAVLPWEGQEDLAPAGAPGEGQAACGLGSG